jgi:DNA repair protein RecO (recombination protein O)
MPVEKALAIVLRVVDWSESSCVVTLFTREFGKVRGIAKGGRRLKGPFESALDLLATCRVVFLRKSSEALDLLTEARLERRFRPGGRDLSRLYAGYYVAELLGEMTDDYDPHPALFDAADEALRGLAGDAPLAPCVLRFEMTALNVLGHLPSLETCADCGKPVPVEGRVAFGLLAGGVLCGECRTGKRQVVAVSADVLRALTEFAKAGDGWRGLAVERRTMGELRGLLNRYLANLLGRRPRMHRYLGILSD